MVVLQVKTTQTLEAIKDDVGQYHSKKQYLGFSRWVWDWLGNMLGWGLGVLRQMLLGSVLGADTLHHAPTFVSQEGWSGGVTAAVCGSFYLFSVCNPAKPQPSYQSCSRHEDLPKVAILQSSTVCIMVCGFPHWPSGLCPPAAACLWSGEMDDPTSRSNLPCGVQTGYKATVMSCAARA